MDHVQQKGGGYNDAVCVQDTVRVRSKIEYGIMKQIKCSRQRNEWYMMIGLANASVDTCFQTAPTLDFCISIPSSRLACQ